MFNLDSDALICDLAEYYHIYNYRELPPSKVATFSCGLREDSRIKSRLLNLEVTYSTFLITSIFDLLNLIWWSKTEDGQRNVNRPEFISKKMIIEETKESDIPYFETGEDFENYRNKLLGKGV